MVLTLSLTFDNHTIPMASSPPLLFLLCFFFSTFTYTSLSQTLFLPLTHSLSQTHFNSTHHLLHSSATRSSTRFHRKTHQQNRQVVSLPLSPGSDYTLSFSLGPTSQPVSLFMDTGSDLVWFPCSPFTCILCEGKPNSTFPPPILPKNAAVSCSSPSCSAVHSAIPSRSLCAIATCPLDSIELSECSRFRCPPFYYAYGDGSLIATLYEQTLSLPISIDTSLNLPNFTFGCSHTALAESIGVAGFGRGALSLPAQIAGVSPHLGSQFSYCLVAHSFDQDKTRRPSPLILGRYEQDSIFVANEYIYTEMLPNPKHPYYYCVGLAGISVGKRVVPAPEILRRVDEKGDGGVVVDSGTTFTMLPERFYKSIVAEFDRRVGRVYKRATEVEYGTGLGPCYYLNDGGVVELPGISLHFMGKKSSVVLPRKNYFYEFETDGGDGRRRKVGCWMMMMNGGDDMESGGGPGAVLGNYQQQGFEVVYDLEKERVGFARRECSVLWDNLNQK